MQLRRLVCGLPSEKRDARLFLVLQIFIDDSGRGVDPAFVLAGYVGRVANWESFSDEWQKILNEKPKLNYIKATEAIWLKGEFAGWTPADRDRRVIRLVKLIKRYAMYAVDLSIDLAAFDLILRQKRGVFKQPEGLAFSHIVTWMLGRASERKTLEKIELIFDGGVISREKHIIETYVAFMKHLPAELTSLLYKRPRFEDDKEVLPIQAADLWAWHVRRQYYERARNSVWESPIWDALLTIPTQTIRLREREIQEFKNRLIARGVQF